MDRRERNRFYARRAWRALRDLVLREEPLCRTCWRETGKLVPATEVDHVVALGDDPSRALDRQNLQPLCKPCHSVKTLQEVTGRPVHRRRAKQWGCNLDGTPKDPSHPWNRSDGEDPK
jgi:5-methylcytosine-specific restriction protein A